MLLQDLTVEHTHPEVVALAVREAADWGALMEGSFNGNIRFLSAIPSPASVIGVGEGRGASPWSLAGGNGPWDYPSVEGQCDARRHAGTSGIAALPAQGTTCTFMDGHSKWVRLGQSINVPGNLWTCRDDD